MFLIVVFRDKFSRVRRSVGSGSEDQWERDWPCSRWTTEIVRRREAIQLSEDSCGIDSY